MVRKSKEKFAAHLIVGGDAYLRTVLRDEVIAATVSPEHRGMAVAGYSLEDISLEEALRQATLPPLFSPRQVLILTEAEEIEDGDLALLSGYFEAASETTTVIFESERLDRRTRVARLLLEYCQVREADSPDDRATVRIAQEWGRRHGVRLERETAEELVFVLGNDLGRLHRELEKLGTYVGKGGEITVADVEAVVSQARHFSVFDLVDLLAERRRAEVVVRLRQLLEKGENPIGIVGLLSWLYRQLIAARTRPQSTPGRKAAQSFGASRRRAEELTWQAQRFGAEELREGFLALLEADVALKSSPPDPAAVLEGLVVRLIPARGSAPGVRP